MLDLCYEVIDQSRVRLSDLAARAGIGEEEAMAQLDSLAAQGLLERELEMTCPRCGEPHAFFGAKDEWPLLEQVDHSCGGHFLTAPKHLRVVYTPTAKLVEAPIERGPRSRLSSLAG